MKSMASLSIDESAVVERIDETSPMRRRLFDIGLAEGTKVVCLQKSIFGGICAYLIRNTVIAIRSEDAQFVIVK